MFLRRFSECGLEYTVIFQKSSAGTKCVSTGERIGDSSSGSDRNISALNWC
jgi:hypothetical protein